MYTHAVLLYTQLYICGHSTGYPSQPLRCWSWCCVTIVFPIIALSIAKDTDVPEVLQWCALIAFLVSCIALF